MGGNHMIEISEKVHQLLGLHFPSTQYVDLERRIKSAAKELGKSDHYSSIQEWMSQQNFNHQELNTLSAHLTVNETYFFREKPALDLFQQRIIPELIQQRQQTSKTIRIWCAGCSSGEEPYTLAMILKQYFPELSDWNISILATDISPTAIQKALHGEYTDWSFRETEPSIQNKYFTPSGKNWIISSEIKRMVSFSYLNLSKNSYPSSLTDTENMDVIFCRNVMMYFSPKVIHEVSGRFRAAIVENGWFITSQVELNDEYFGNFERVNFNSGIFYRKSNAPKVIITKQPSHAVLPKTIKPKIKPDIVKKSIEIPKATTRISPPIAPKTIKKTTPSAHFNNGNYDLCIESCISYIDTEQLTVEIFTLLIKSLANSGKLKEGNKIIQKIFTSHSATVEMYYIYASFLKEQNEALEAENLLKKAIYLNHEHILSHLMLGELHLKRDNITMAVKHYDTSIQLLNKYSDDEIVPDSDGLTAGGIKALAENILNNM
ncbi:MAG: protein-glutamate O-methyltransferase CheR [Bacteroidales bacterium]|nr:protein-glutamate O-methyltransferase CheR [Bacteroidales bacterium]